MDWAVYVDLPSGLGAKKQTGFAVEASSSPDFSADTDHIHPVAVTRRKPLWRDMGEAVRQPTSKPAARRMAPEVGFEPTIRLRRINSRGDHSAKLCLGRT